MILPHTWSYCSLPVVQLSPAQLEVEDLLPHTLCGVMISCHTEGHCWEGSDMLREATRLQPVDPPQDKVLLGCRRGTTDSRIRFRVPLSTSFLILFRCSSEGQVWLAFPCKTWPEYVRRKGGANSLDNSWLSYDSKASYSYAHKIHKSLHVWHATGFRTSVTQQQMVPQSITKTSCFKYTYS